MRFFTYISDAKVDMLLPQVPHGVQQKLAAEVGFNFGVVSGKVGAEVQPLESRVARLVVVEQHVRSTEHVEPPGADAKWIGGELSMSSVDIGDGCLLFVGEADEWLLALGGSARHLAGGAAPRTAEITFSFLHDIASRLAELTANEPAMLDVIPERLHVDTLAPGVHQGAKAWAELITWCSGLHERSPQQRLGFLAKRLAAQQYGGRSVILASPLYIEVLD
jgi:hypothetical protein